VNKMISKAIEFNPENELSKENQERSKIASLIKGLEIEEMGVAEKIGKPIDSSMLFNLNIDEDTGSSKVIDLHKSSFPVSSINFNMYESEENNANDESGINEEYTFNEDYSFNKEYNLIEEVNIQEDENISIEDYILSIAGSSFNVLQKQFLLDTNLDMQIAKTINGITYINKPVAKYIYKIAIDEIANDNYMLARNMLEVLCTTSIDTSYVNMALDILKIENVYSGDEFVNIIKKTIEKEKTLISLIRGL